MNDSKNTLWTRRRLVASGAAALAGGALLGRRADGQSPPSTTSPSPADRSPTTLPTEPGQYTPVVVPDGWTLPFRLVDGVKVFHLVAEEIPDHAFIPGTDDTTGLRARCWGYNGSVHGPVIEAVEGDCVRIFVTNHLPEPTTVHWHGIIVPSGMDGVAGLNQPAIAPGETFVYEFTLRQHGTFMYHSHHDEMTQMAMGLVGMFVIHPRERTGPAVDRDFALMLHEWSIKVGASRPDPSEMSEFNVLTINARAFPRTSPLIVKRGDRVRIRLGNLSAMDHHPMHLHGYRFMVTETDGGVIPDSARLPETTVIVGVGQTRTIEFIADNPGDWAFHCHMTHHVMNQMGHNVPNMIGVDTRGIDPQLRPMLPGYMTMGQRGMGGMSEMGMPMPPNSAPMLGGRGRYGEITMGGMFTILKVREHLADGYDVDPGAYEDLEGTRAANAAESLMSSNGIDGKGIDVVRRPR